MSRLILIFFVFYFFVAALGQEGLRVNPYLQNPTSDGMTLIWFTDNNEPGQVIYGLKDSKDLRIDYSMPAPAPALAYSLWEDTLFFMGEAPPAPYRHRVRMEGLEAACTYEYRLVQGSLEFAGEFRTAPSGDANIRIVVYSDSETEPESTGAFAGWSDTAGQSRSYMVDQSQGYRNNLEVICSRDPDLVFIAGDLVQHGGEQRDWDEFWRFNAGSELVPGLASEIPLMPALGNHEYYEGTSAGLYNQPQSEQAVDKYQSYFELPANHSPNADQEGRYYSLEYGPATFIVLDVCNNGLNSSEEDTNFYLLGESDSAGGNAPDFGPGSRQYQWMEEQLVSAQGQLFTFVLFHHAPYSSGPHSFPPGTEALQDNQSGVPVRQLTPLFFKYGVDAVFSGHDEMWERSELSGEEELAGGSMQPYILHFYDVGIGGDGLRGPSEESGNPFQSFLAHHDAPEIWEDSVLLEGGKHYGHLEVNISQVGEGRWQALLDPVYILPVKHTGDSTYTGYSRKLYDDRVIIERETDSVNISSGLIPSIHSPGPGIIKAYPNPFGEEVTISVELTEAGSPSFTIYDVMGKVVYAIENQYYPSGIHNITWDGTLRGGARVPAGIYQVQMYSGSGTPTVLRLVRL